MSFRNHIRKLKPIQETQTAPVDKVQNVLTEAQLKKADIFKRDNQNTFVSFAKDGNLSDKNGNKLDMEHLHLDPEDKHFFKKRYKKP